MPMNVPDKDTQEKMDAAADEFKAEFRFLVSGLGYSEKQAISKMVDLIDEYAGSAGYKRMVRFLRDERRKICVEDLDEM